MYTLAAHMHIPPDYDMPSAHFLHLFNMYKKDEMEEENRNRAQAAAANSKRAV